jgi:hypothetical protein
MSEKNIWAFAQQIIDEFGEEAIEECFKHADAAHRERNDAAFDRWAAIMLAVHKLTKGQKPEEDRSLH